MHNNHDIIIAKIREFYLLRMRMPSYSEIAKLLGLSSKESAYRQVQKLIQENLLSKDSTGKLLPVIMLDSVANRRHPNDTSSQYLVQDNSRSETGIPLLGLVEAGFPSDVEQEELDIVSLENWLVKSHADTYMLQVRGDSMIEAGIYNGDHVIVSRAKQAKIGDIVIARLDGGMTMKYLRSSHGQLYLEPANQSYSDLYPERELEVQAVVTAIIRKLD